MIAVILPVLNEERRLPAQLAALRDQAFAEILVVDGGSTDRSRALAAEAGVRVVEGPRGRARQMNAGAALAGAPVLLFLHADVSLPPDASARIERALADPSVVFGAFKLHTRRDDGRAAPWLRLADLRSRYTTLPYGDQAIFVRAAAFHRVGGFPDQPLLEDLELSRRLRAIGRYARVDAEVVASARRFEKGLLSNTFFINVAPLLYRLGASPEHLRAWYPDLR